MKKIMLFANALMMSACMTYTMDSDDSAAPIVIHTGKRHLVLNEEIDSGEKSDPFNMQTQELQSDEALRRSFLEKLRENLDLFGSDRHADIERDVNAQTFQSEYAKSCPVAWETLRTDEVERRKNTRDTGLLRILMRAASLKESGYWLHIIFARGFDPVSPRMTGILESEPLLMGCRYGHAPVVEALLKYAFTFNRERVNNVGYLHEVNGPNIPLKPLGHLLMGFNPQLSRRPAYPRLQLSEERFLCLRMLLDTGADATRPFFDHYGVSHTPLTYLLTHFDIHHGNTNDALKELSAHGACSDTHPTTLELTPRDLVHLIQHEHFIKWAEDNTQAKIESEKGDNSDRK